MEERFFTLLFDSTDAIPGTNLKMGGHLFDHCYAQPLSKGPESAALPPLQPSASSEKIVKYLPKIPGIERNYKPGLIEAAKNYIEKLVMVYNKGKDGATLADLQSLQGLRKILINTGSTCLFNLLSADGIIYLKQIKHFH